MPGKIVVRTKTGTSGNVDTYTITYTNGQSTTFTVTNGAVTSVAGKTGAVTLNAGDVSYSDSTTYSNGTVGKEISGLKSALEDLADVTNVHKSTLQRYASGKTQKIPVTRLWPIATNAAPISPTA